MKRAKDKIVNRKKLASILENLRKKGHKIVFTNGCFDLLHVGHVRYLTEAKKKGDVLVVAINTDQSIKKLKGTNRPLTPEAERAEILSALAAVDFVTYFDQDTPAEIISQLKPNVLVKGADYKIKEIVGHDFMSRSGGKVVRVPLAKNYSTTKIIDSIIAKYG